MRHHVNSAGRLVHFLAFRDSDSNLYCLNLSDSFLLQTVLDPKIDLR